MKKALVLMAVLLLAGCKAPGVYSGEEASATEELKETIVVQEVEVEPTKEEREALFIKTTLNVPLGTTTGADVILRVGYAACEQLAGGIYPGQFVYDYALPLFQMEHDRVLDFSYIAGVANAILCPPNSEDIQ